jgi:iron complex outermembrane receptor protein
MAFTRTSSPTRTTSSIFLEDTSVRGRLIWNVVRRSVPGLSRRLLQVEAGAINFNATFAIPAFVDAFGAPNYDQDPNDVDFRFIFNTPGENEQETLDFAIKADWALGFADLVASVAYNDLEEYLLSDGTAATFYGYELTPSCQAGRAELNSFTRPDLFGEPFNPFGVLPPGADFQGVYGPYNPLTCDGYQYQERNQQDFSIDMRLVGPEDGPCAGSPASTSPISSASRSSATARTRGRASCASPMSIRPGPTPRTCCSGMTSRRGLCRLRPARV